MQALAVRFASSSVKRPSVLVRIIQHSPFNIEHSYLHPPLTQPQSLLLIILDDLRRANFRFVRVKPDVAKGTALAQEVPALIQFDLDFLEPLTIGFVKCPCLVQSMFLCDEALYVIEDWLIFGLIFHGSLLHRGYDRNSQDLRRRPPGTPSTDILTNKKDTTQATLH